jgi:hypothetical protein
MFRPYRIESYRIDGLAVQDKNDVSPLISSSVEKEHKITERNMNPCGIDLSGVK